MEDSNVDRVKKLFAYLSELSDLKKKPVSNYRNHRGVIKIDSDVKDNHFVDLLPRDEHNGGEEGSPLLMVRYPTKTPKPPAPSILDPYLAKGMRVDGNTLVTAQGDPAEIPHRPEIQVEIDRWVKDLEAWKKPGRKNDQPKPCSTSSWTCAANSSGTSSLSNSWQRISSPLPAAPPQTAPSS